MNDRGEFTLNEYVGAKHNLNRVGTTVADEPVADPNCPHCKKPLTPNPQRPE